MTSYPDLMYLDRVCTTLDIDLPEEFNRALAVLRAGLSAASQHPAHQLVAMFEDGTLTAATVGAEVRRAAVDLTVQQNALSLVRDLTIPLGKHARKAIRDHGDDLVTQLRPRFDHAAEQLMVAAGLLGPDPSAEDVLHRGAAAGDAWRSLSGHAETLDTINAARVQMMLFGYAPTENRAALFVEGSTIATPKAMAAANEAYLGPTGPGGRFFALASAGHRLRLNLAQEVAEIDGAVEANLAAAKAARARGPER